MYRHNPIGSRITISGVPIVIYNPGDGSRRVPVTIENDSAKDIYVYTDAAAPFFIRAGFSAQFNPDIKVYAYSTDGSSVEIGLVTGVRFMESGSSTAASASIEAQSLAVELTHKEIAAETLMQLRIMNRYFSEWEGEAFRASDVLKE